MSYRVIVCYTNPIGPSIEDHSMPLQQLAPSGDFSDEVVPLTSGSCIATSGESEMTSTSKHSESPLLSVSCSEHYRQ